ncbi:MAG: hypothetical protein OEV43_09985, partial [Coriobacteriia bacterium]|nr:hypothetical protein [Coriobacteriia bacterium]
MTYQQCEGADGLYVDTSFVSASTCVNSDCHNRATSTSFTPVCGDCHETNVGMHGYDAIDHAADVTDTVDPMGVTCGSCHSMDVLAEHEKPSSSPAGGGCDTCHPTPRDSFEVWGQGCEQGGCHATGSPQEKHLNVASGHSPAAGNEICFDCHEGTDLPTLHSTATTTTPSGTYSDCNVCHRPDATVLSNDCAVCHFTFEDHYGAERHTSTWTLEGCSATGCHTTRDLMGVHAEQSPAFGCGGCHESELPEVVEAIDLGYTACDACHAGVTQTEGHRAVHWAMPLLQDTDGPNYSYWTGSAGTLPTGDCAGCHVSNLVDEHMGVYDAETGNPIRLPRRDDTGQALACPTCHESFDTNVLDAILLGETNCDACHTVHGPISEIHDSTFVDSPEYDCALCHDADVSDEHNGAFSVETPGGQTLVGCDVCHAYYEGDRGAQVQDAISVVNDTRCSACHATYHGDSGASHSAETTPSVEGCGVCHDDDPTAVELDVTAIHADAAAGPCAVCHANPARVPDIALETAECASCHASEGTDYHLDMGVHVSPDAALCSGQCHHQNPDVTASSVHPACTTCHTVVNTEGITSACTNCHLIQGVDYHLDYDVRHVPTDSASQDCARCHESTTDVRVIHATDECATCHTGACADCHISHGGMGGGVLLRGTQCSSCHDVVGTNYHTEMEAAHTFAAMDPSCTGSGCHAANTLPEAHEAYVSRYPAYS